MVWERACWTISTSTFRVSAELVTSRTKAIDCCHCRFLRLNVGKPLGEQDERILVVGIHVLNDFSHMVSQRGGLAAIIIGGCYPAHYSETAHVVNINHIHAIKRKVFKIYPILAVGVTCQVELANLCHLGVGHRQN